MRDATLAVIEREETMSQAMIAEFRQRVTSKIVAVVFLVLGVGLCVGGAVTHDPAEQARTMVLLGIGGLCSVAGIVTFIDSAIKARRDRRIRVYADRIEIVEASREQPYSFSALRAFEGKVIVVQNTGARLHAYRLVFDDAAVELTAGDYLGVTADTGALLASVTGRNVSPWL